MHAHIHIDETDAAELCRGEIGELLYLSRLEHRYLGADTPEEMMLAEAERDSYDAARMDAGWSDDTLGRRLPDPAWTREGVLHGIAMDG